MNTKDILGFLGLCRKAGKLLCGHDVVKESVISSASQLVFLSSDASERLEREMRHACSYEGKSIPVYRTPISMDEFGISLGKKSAVFSVTDTGFANKIIQKFGEELHDN